MKNTMKKLLSLLLVAVMLSGGIIVPMQTSVASTTYKNGDTIQYGTYPKSRVSDSKSIAGLEKVDKAWKTYGRYTKAGTYLDWFQYADFVYGDTKYRAINLINYYSGYESENGYSKNTIYYFKYSPLSWKVLDASSGLIICSEIIDCRAYQDIATSNASDYSQSFIRDWLNEDFYQTAFTENQKNNIKTTNIDTEGSVFIANSTSDKLFLTSYDEANTLLNSSSRDRYGTDYSKCLGLHKMPGNYYGWGRGQSWWWLRTPYDEDETMTVYDDGAGGGSPIRSYYVDNTSIGVVPACCLAELKNDVEWDFGAIFPDGYDYNQDRWIFQNPLDTVSKEIYIEAFGNMKGTVLAGLKESKSHGLCYGLSATMATILNHNSILTSFERQNRYASKMADIERYELLSEYNSAQYGMELEKFIKIAFISQYDSTVSEELNGNKNKLKELCAAVKKYVQGDGAALHIVLTKSDGLRHSISPLGIVETDENIVMYVFDTNYNHAEVTDNRIIIDKSYNSWRYTTNDYSYSSSAGSSISYNYPSSLMYNVLQIYQNNQNKSNVKMLTSDKKLIVANKKMESNDDLIDINYSVADSNSDNIQNNYAYWYNKDDATIILTPDESTAITVVGQYSSITATVPENTDASFIIEDGTEDQFSCDYKKNSDINVAFAFANEHGEISAISIFGIAIGDTITATQTETGLVVTGISDGTVTLSKDDEVIATQTISDAISDIEITYDKTGEDESIEVDYEQPEEPTDPEVPTEPEMPTEPDVPAEPDEPTDDTTDCSCMCHSKNSFMQFFYKIFRLFWQLFGMNMDCACGAKHFDAYFFG